MEKESLSVYGLEFGDCVLVKKTTGVPYERLCIVLSMKGSSLNVVDIPIEYHYYSNIKGMLKAWSVLSSIGNFCQRMIEKSLYKVNLEDYIDPNISINPLLGTHISLETSGKTYKGIYIRPVIKNNILKHEVIIQDDSEDGYSVGISGNFKLADW